MFSSIFGFGQVVLAGWTFPTTSGVGSDNVAAECGVYMASSNLYANGTNGSSTWAVNTSNLEYFTGTTLNTTICSVNTATGGLAFKGGPSIVNNGKYIVFKTSTLNYKDINFSMAVRGTASAFTTHDWDYSFDGSTWEALTTYNGMNTNVFVVNSPLNGSHSVFNNRPNVYLRCQLSGSTAGGSNVCFDNVKISGTEITPTILPSVCNNTFDVVPGEIVGANAIAGATNYRFKFIDQANDEYFVEDEDGSMTIYLFAQEIGAGFKYDHTYTASVQAYVNGDWTGYGPSCNFSITNDPRTKIRADFCNQTISALDVQIFADRLPLFPNYIFEIKNTTTNQTVTITRTPPVSTGFRFTVHAPSIMDYGVVYEITVKATDGVTTTNVGTMCTVTTPTLPPPVKLRPANSCGVTLTANNQTLLSSTIAINATQYAFEVTNLTTNHVEELTNST